MQLLAQVNYSKPLPLKTKIERFCVMEKFMFVVTYSPIVQIDVYGRRQKNTLSFKKTQIVSAYDYTDAVKNFKRQNLGYILSVKPFKR